MRSPAGTGLACGAASGNPAPDADRPVACWTGCHLAAARVKGAPRARASLRDWPAAALDPAVVQAARRHRSPGAGEEQRPTSRQEARTVADQQGTPTPAGTC